MNEKHSMHNATRGSHWLTSWGEFLLYEFKRVCGCAGANTLLSVKPILEKDRERSRKKGAMALGLPQSEKLVYYLDKL